MQQGQSRVFKYEDGVAVALPDDSGFEVGDDIIMFRVGDTIHILHANAPQEEVDYLMNLAA